MAEPVEIEIFGRTYQIRGEKDVAYTRELAKYVDEKMCSVADRSPPSASPVEIAVLTLLHIVNELFEIQGSMTQSEEAVQEKAISLIEILDSSLRESK